MERHPTRRAGAARGLNAGLALFLAVVAIGCGGSGAEADARAPAVARASDETLPADLDGDGVDEVVAVYLSEDGTRGFFSVQTATGAVVSRIYPMWAAAAGDLDGDGRDSLVLGVWSTVRRFDDPGPHRSVWVVDLVGDRFVPRWRGSGLARPLVDFRLADLDGDGATELIAVEAGRRSCYLTAYDWTGFGFAGAARVVSACEGVGVCEDAGDRWSAACRSPADRALESGLLESMWDAQMGEGDEI